jgi:hypothetical protein
MAAMHASTIIAILALIVSGPIAWIVRGIVMDLRRLDRDLADHRVDVASRYVERSRHDEMLSEIKEMIGKLDEKLDRYRDSK